MKAGHLPVLAEEVVEMLRPHPAAFRSMPPWAAVGTPSGSWRRPTLMAASSASMPMGRPSPESSTGSAAVRRSTGRSARRTSASSATVAPEAGFGAVDGGLFDLGLSSYQLADADARLRVPRGGPLDMRFDPTRGVPAAELLATLDGAELTALFRRYGEEPRPAGSPAPSSSAREDRADRRPPRSSPA